MSTINLRSKSVLALIFWLVLTLALHPPVQASGDGQISLQAVVPVTSNIIIDTTWTAGNVYYILNDIEVMPGITLTIEGGAIVKFWVPFDPSKDPLTGMVVSGYLQFTNAGPLDAERVIFTSGRDDTIGGDTNGDGVQTLPAPGDWDFVRLTRWADTDPSYQYMNVRYAKDGFNFHNATSTTPAPVIEDNLFVENVCGLTFSLTTNGSIEGQINRNTFTGNKYGFCARRTGGYGQVNPALNENIFNNNTILPIYLYGTSYPTYSSNTFSGLPDPGDRLGIGLGGEFNGSGTLTIVDEMPFVFVSPMDVKANLTIPAGAVFKSFTRYDLAKSTDPLPGMRIYSDVTFQSTESEPIIFTSYRDDSVNGDTNGDDIDTEPYPADWAGVLFVDAKAPGTSDYTFQYLHFRYAVNGLLYQTTSTAVGARMPTIVDDRFEYNQNGLRFRAVTNNVNSRIEPVIQDSFFIGQGIIPAVKTDVEPGVPIMLENVVQPTYYGNTFSGNLHPAIGITGKWRGHAALVQVAGQGMARLPFLVHGDTWVGDGNISGGVDSAASLTIPENSILKFFVNAFDREVRSRLLASGRLILEQTTAANSFIFTSYFDDTYGGDTDGGAPISPASRDWGSVVIRQPESDIFYSLFRYGDKALHVQNKSTALDFGAEISHSIFENNDYGLYLDIQATKDITSLISNNIFRYNRVGLGTFAKDTLNQSTKTTGLSRPVFRENLFLDNTDFPMYLNGSATLEFFEETNSFVDNDHSAIALGGYFGSEGPFTIILPRVTEGPASVNSTRLVPYVVWMTTNFDWKTPATLAGDLVFKFNTGKDLRFYGPMTMQTAPGLGNIFTSYRDDSAGGDTNGTPAPDPAPARGDWGGLYLYNTKSAAFSYSVIRYATQGLVLIQKENTLDVGDITFGVTNNTFTLNKNGLTLYISSNFDITSTISDNVFVLNDYGIHSYANPDTDHYGIVAPSLERNNFSEHAEFPLYYQGSTDPTYIANNFWANTHPAIAVGGVWCRDATWTKVWDLTFNQNMPYVVKDTVDQEVILNPAPDPDPLTPKTIPVLTLPDSLIVKFMSGPYIYAYGYLNLLSEPGKEIVFTSYDDDTFAGDINHNGATQPTRTAWKTVWLMDYPGKFNHMHDLEIYYATAGLGLYYLGPENTQTVTEIGDTEIASSHSGIVMVIGWRSSGGVITIGKGNIHADLHDIVMRDSNYGILTVAHDQSWGIMNPTLENITFSNIANYPIFLGGTSYFSYLSGGITGSPQTFEKVLSGAAAASGADGSLEGAALELGGFDLPGNRAVMESIEPGSASLQVNPSPQANLTAAPNLYPAIGLGGAWNNTGELAQIDGVPYAVVGNFPLTIYADTFTNYKPANDMTIGAANTANAIVSVPADTVFKFNKDRMMVAKGTLNLLSSDTQPIIFTSMKDDSAAGDTNRDGATTLPAKGDWGEVRLAATNTFNNAVVRYATKGLHIYFDGGVNLNNASSVNHSTFIENTNGISLTTLNDGDLASSIVDSTFNRNTTHILGYPTNTGKTGHLCIQAHNNDLFGTKVTQNGIVNNNLNGHNELIAGCTSGAAFNATSNYWGDDSGPYHPTLNSAGLGSVVSDRVLFDPWLGLAVNPPAKYTISGRITKDTADGDGLPGVLVTLQGPVPVGTTAITDSAGYYRFDNLQEGAYVVYPGLSGYLFAPSSMNINLAGSDAEDVNFIGVLSPAEVVFSVNNVSVFRPLSATPKKYCTFTVSINKALAPGHSATVEYNTLAGTALPGVDYVTKSGKLTFLAGGSLSQFVNVELKVTNSGDPAEYFFLVLKNPVNGLLDVSSGTCTISPANPVFLPLIKK